MSRFLQFIASFFVFTAAGSPPALTPDSAATAAAAQAALIAASGVAVSDRMTAN